MSKLLGPPTVNPTSSAESVLCGSGGREQWCAESWLTTPDRRVGRSILRSPLRRNGHTAPNGSSAGQRKIAQVSKGSDRVPTRARQSQEGIESVGSAIRPDCHPADQAAKTPPVASRTVSQPCLSPDALGCWPAIIRCLESPSVDHRSEERSRPNRSLIGDRTRAGSRTGWPTSALDVDGHLDPSAVGSYGCRGPTGASDNAVPKEAWRPTRCQAPTSRRTCPFETSDTCDPERSRLAGRATLCAPASRESGAIQRALPALSTISSLAGIGPADPSCTSATDWPLGPTVTDSSGGGVHSLIAVTVDKKMARAMSAIPTPPNTLWSRERRVSLGEWFSDKWHQGRSLQRWRGGPAR